MIIGQLIKYGLFSTGLVILLVFIAVLLIKYGRNLEKIKATEEKDAEYEKCKRFILLILLCLLMSVLIGCANTVKTSCPICMYRFDLTDFEKLNVQNQIFVMDFTDYCEDKK